MNVAEELNVSAHACLRQLTALLETLEAASLDKRLSSDDVLELRLVVPCAIRKTEAAITACTRLALRSQECIDKISASTDLDEKTGKS